MCSWVCSACVSDAWFIYQFSTTTRWSHAPHHIWNDKVPLIIHRSSIFVIYICRFSYMNKHIHACSTNNVRQTVSVSYTAALAQTRTRTRASAIGNRMEEHGCTTKAKSLSLCIIMRLHIELQHRSNKQMPTIVGRLFVIGRWWFSEYPKIGCIAQTTGNVPTRWNM